MLTVFALGILRVANKSGSESDLFAELAEDHAHTLSNARLISSDRVAISAWLSERVPFVVFVPVFPNTEFHGARLAMMDSRTSAVVEYSVNGKMMSYFILPDAASTVGRPDRSPPGVHLLPEFRIGYEIVSWREAGLLHAMVGRLSKSQLHQFAQSCLQQMEQSMPRVGAAQ